MVTKTCNYRQDKYKAEKMKIITQHHLPLKNDKILEHQKARETEQARYSAETHLVRMFHKALLFRNQPTLLLGVYICSVCGKYSEK